MALSPLLTESQGRRVPAGRTRGHRLLRIHPAVVPQVRTCVCLGGKKCQGELGDIWFINEVFVMIRGRHQCLWRALDQDGDTVDILVQSRRDRRAAERFFRKLLKALELVPQRIVTDKLRSHSATRRLTMPSVPHVTTQYANNRAEVSHEPTRQREREMRRFKSPGQAQRFLTVHAVVGNLFRLGRHLTRAVPYRALRTRAFTRW